MREHDNRNVRRTDKPVIEKKCLVRAVMEVSVPVGTVFNWFPASGQKPAHWHVRLFDDAGNRKSKGIDIHLRDGLPPPAAGETLKLTGLVEVKQRDVSAPWGDEEHQYVYLNIFPADAEAAPVYSLSFSSEKPEKTDVRFRTYGRENGFVAIDRLE